LCFETYQEQFNRLHKSESMKTNLKHFSRILTFQKQFYWLILRLGCVLK